MSVVFPLYGCETGEKMNYQKTKGLNKRQNAPRCEWLLGTANQMWPKSVKGMVAPAIVVSGTWRVLASYEAP